MKIGIKSRGSIFEGFWNNFGPFNFRTRSYEKLDFSKSTLNILFEVEMQNQSKFKCGIQIIGWDFFSMSDSHVAVFNKCITRGVNNLLITSS